MFAPCCQDFYKILISLKLADVRLNVFEMDNNDLNVLISCSGMTQFKKLEFEILCSFKRRPVLLCNSRNVTNYRSYC